MFLILRLLIPSLDRDSAVGLATLYGLDGLGIEYRWGEIFVLLHTGRVAHPASYTMANGSFFKAKWQRRGFHHPHHLVPRLKEEWMYYSTTPLLVRGLLLGEVLVPSSFSWRYKCTLESSSKFCINR